ncbi:MAG TPA: hypothetical protein VJ983_03040, partial [candidate division Zixibacteria bacterium]|nr:hypothetical protein [candidate division Zixibacteria bacterium]
MVRSTDQNQGVVSRSRTLISRLYKSMTWYRKLVILTCLLGVGWTLMTIASLFWTVQQHDDSTTGLILAEARFRLATGQTLRAW